MLLFTQQKCPACKQIKELFPLKRLGIEEVVVDGEDHKILSLLAWHGLIDMAKKSLPILVTKEGMILTGSKKIERYLKDII